MQYVSMSRKSIIIWCKKKVYLLKLYDDASLSVDVWFVTIQKLCKVVVNK